MFNQNALQKTKNIGLIVFSICLLLGILSGIFFYNEKPFGDSTYYYNAANLLKENFKVLFTSPKIGVGESLNATFQGVAMLLPGNDFVNVYAIQIVIYSLTGLFMYLLAEMFVGKTAALLAIAFYIINHNHWVHIYNFKPGVWVNFFLLAAMYFAFNVINNQKKFGRDVFTACFSALLILTDMRYLPHILLLYLIILISYRPFIQSIKNVAVSAIIVIAIVTPWIVRQSIVFGRFIFISDIHTITIAKILNTKRYQSLRNHSMELRKLTENEFNDQFWQLCAKYKYTPGELIYARGNAKIDVINNKDNAFELKYSDLIGRKIFTIKEIEKIIEREERKPSYIKKLKAGMYFWAPFNYRYFYDPLSTYKIFIPPASKMSNLNRILTLGILLPFLLIGMLHLVITKNLFGILLSGMFIIHTLVHVFTYVQWRYLLPILPLVTLVAVHGMMVTYKALLKK